ncbi:phage holin family protein [Thalassospira sp. MCCC 1A01428]|uniref:phage holin family protein n=1 Tax=Thalassospira sp. MCCC 1A01428 TaxID=1470575 RepID=UPI000A1FEEA9|nr:phage holin family protein [Thalassospira sp. MCCC 1A01428]
MNQLPPEVGQDWISAVRGWGGALGIAMIARLLWHQRLVRLGQRRFWSWELLWEVPTAAFSAIVGAGIAAYLSLDGDQSLAVIGICGWLGPRGAEALVDRILQTYVARQSPKD